MQDDAALLMEWAMDTLEHQLPGAVVDDDEIHCFPSLQALRDVSHVPLVYPPQQLVVADARMAQSGSSGETDGSGPRGGGNFSSAPAANMEHDVLSPYLNSDRGVPSGNGGSTSLQTAVSWNFSAVSTQPCSDGTLELDAAAARPYERGPGVPEMAYAPRTKRRCSARSRSAATTRLAVTSAPSAQDHIMAERKRREKINQRFIALSTVIPGLKKMDKATILSDATRHVKELQEKIKTLELEAAGRSTSETVVLVKRPCCAVPADENSSPSSSSSGVPAPAAAARNLLPEIEVRFSENGVMVRVLCENAKGLAMRVLSEVDERLHLGITHANVMPFTASTVIITITAKVEEGFSVTAEEIVGRLNRIASAPERSS